MTPYGLSVNCLAVALSIFLGLFVRLTDAAEPKADEVPNYAFQILQCYQCQNQGNNSFCSRPSDLTPCKTAYKSNVCSTKVVYTPEHGTRITKSCDTGPCTLDSMGSLALGFDKLCDRTQPKWICSSCCSGDGCNINLGQKTVSATATLIITIIGHFLMRGL